jgi:hypothetical protein
MKNETKNADGHTFKEWLVHYEQTYRPHLYDAAADKETEEAA